MIKIYSPNNEVELAFIKSILEGDGIPYFVHNDHFGSLRAGFILQLFNEKTIYVGENYEARAQVLIQDFLDKTRTEPIKDSWADRVRMSIEALFAWSIPGKGWKKGFPKEDLIPVIINLTIAICTILMSLWFIEKISNYLHYYFKHKFYY
jgi:Putative prokaryotic signal transducing protein